MQKQANVYSESKRWHCTVSRNFVKMLTEFQVFLACRLNSKFAEKRHR